MDRTLINKYYNEESRADLLSHPGCSHPHFPYCIRIGLILDPIYT